MPAGKYVRAPAWQRNTKPYPETPKPALVPVPTGRRIGNDPMADEVLIRAHIHIDAGCVVDLMITGTATEAGKARLIRIIELAMDVHIIAGHEEG